MFDVVVNIVKVYLNVRYFDFYGVFVGVGNFFVFLVLVVVVGDFYDVGYEVVVFEDKVFDDGIELGV